MTDRLTDREKANLNAPLSLDELGEVVKAMKRNKCPGLDGAPVEFFQILWEKVGPLLLLTISTSIAQGAFPFGLSRGLIVLPKKGD